MTKLTRQEASKLIAEKLAAARALVSECEGLADEYRVGFNLDIGGYGMGGYYEPVELDENGNPKTDRWGDEIGGWNASSQSC